VVTPQNSSDPPRLLNYLTAPHVMVWSAAVASSSLPGVFEANRLVVKEADGWERYESGGGQAFSDGSMEQDLPMTQLSEMFNVNHFIISQANPHAVMFASYSNKNSVWSNPFTGFLDGIIRFLRDQVRSWLLHLIECVGARRIAPLFETQRGIGYTFFTQEYEGRSIDISLIPWLGHRGLSSALLHIIYNPSEAEFRDWIQAAARETWRHLPAIKSHIAEEVTLDRCVQRLRRRVIQETWEKRSRVSSTEKPKMSDRVPSFFNSPSLVNMGGLNISEQQLIENLPPLRSKSPVSGDSDDGETPQVQPPTHKDTPIIIPDIDINSGWGGMGLRGNRSSGNLQRQFSEASGLFIEDEEHPAQQNAGEDTISNLKKSASGKISSSRDSENSLGYIKTSNMAHFYYRKNPSFGNEAELARMHKTTSDPILERDDTNDNVSATEKSSKHRRQRSKSHADLYS
jgi:predicted acylesterase/phospholipase RssA